MKLKDEMTVRSMGCVLEVIRRYVAPGKIYKLRHCFPKALQTFWPQYAGAL